MSKKIRSFTDLDAWKQAYQLVLMIYKITKKFLKEKRFSLVNQIRRAAISISSNIAEGFSRRFYSEKIQFYSIAQGSLTELQNQLLVSRDVKYLKEENFDKIAQQTIRVNKLINGLIKKSKTLQELRNT